MLEQDEGDCVNLNGVGPGEEFVFFAVCALK